MKWLGILLIIAAISCAAFGGLIIDRGYGPQWGGIALISVSLAIAGFFPACPVLKKASHHGVKP
ncbi:MAG: hypothetical protein KKF66_05515, partial [Actinobacteria bacterium]|nr:hypothetical protein [Actinomycetota bacterium]